MNVCLGNFCVQVYSLIIMAMAEAETTTHVKQIGSRPNAWTMPPSQDDVTPVTVKYRLHEPWPQLPPNTYLFEFSGTGAWGQTSEVARAALLGQGRIQEDDVLWGFHMERPGQHYLTFQEGLDMSSLDGLEIPIKDRIKAKISAVNSNRLSIKVVGVHPTIEEGAIRYALSKFLPDHQTAVIEPRKPLRRQEVLVRTKTPAEKIPHHLEATDPFGMKHRMRVLIPGRPTICPLCEEDFHFATACRQRKRREDNVAEAEAQGRRFAAEARRRRREGDDGNSPQSIWDQGHLSDRALIDLANEIIDDERMTEAQKQDAERRKKEIEDKMRAEELERSLKRQQEEANKKKKEEDELKEIQRLEKEKKLKEIEKVK